MKKKKKFSKKKKKKSNYKVIKFFGECKKKKIHIALTLRQTKPYIFKCDDPSFIACHFKIIAKFVAQKLCPLTFSLVNKLKSQS